MWLCSVGIMGTQYIRNEDPPKTLEIEKDSLSTLTIANIYSAYSIGNHLNINLRQSLRNELSFVTLSEESD